MVIVQKLWNYCNMLRNRGLSYGDCAEQLTYLLFLKMADEQSRPTFDRASPIPKGFGWDVLVKLDGGDLEPSGARWTGQQPEGAARRRGLNALPNYSHESLTTNRPE